MILDGWPLIAVLDSMLMVEMVESPSELRVNALVWMDEAKVDSKEEMPDDEAPLWSV
jgi:hypothetical protein